jgi:DNA-binding CsgD family transcriptional regulator
MSKPGSPFFGPKAPASIKVGLPHTSHGYERVLPAAATDPVDPALFARVIDALETEQFFEALRDFISASVRIDNCVALAFSPDAPPLVLHQWSPQEPNYFQMLYGQGAYVLDPFYRVSQEDKRGGTFLLDDIAPDSFTESDFYQSYYRKVQMIDEIGLLWPIDDKRTIHLSLGRRAMSEHYTAADLASVRRLEPILHSLLRRHSRSRIEQWCMAGQGTAVPAMPSSQPSSDSWLAGYNVTTREAEIAALVLRGHSNTSIGLTLNISMETVKVHRRNLYSKVRISSQAELYMLFIKHILGDDDSARSGIH